MDRRYFLTALGVSLGAGGLVTGLPRAGAAQQGTPAKAPPRPAAGTKQPALPRMTVYKSATCGCCKLWIDHAVSNGFTVHAIDTDDLPKVKAEMGVPADLQSCHTVVVANYLVEGHVPAADIKRMLAEKPAIRGLAVPGMPVGSPGMEQGPPQRYDVIAFTAAGRRSVFARR